MLRGSSKISTKLRKNANNKVHEFAASASGDFHCGTASGTLSIVPVKEGRATMHPESTILKSAGGPD
jgi:hypothetical protein